MKKALALVLALVLALSMAVTSFAAVIELEAASSLTKDNRVTLEELAPYDGASAALLKNTYKVDAEGGEFYFFLQDGYNYSTVLKNIEATCTGAVADAEIVPFDGDTMNTPAGVVYVVTDGVDFVTDTNGTYPASFQADYDKQYAKTEKLFSAPEYKTADGKAAYKPYDYEYAVALAKYLSDGAEVSGKYKAVPATWDGAKFVVANLYVLKLTIEENYTAAYKEGSFKVTATNNTTKKTVAFEGDVISDVTIFEYEQVKWAAEEEDAVVLYAKGYSDFETYLNGYDTNGKYVVNDLRKVDDATVISTTAFRAIKGKDITVALNAKAYVTVEEVAAAQKGVNFAFYDLKAVDVDGKDPAKTGKPVDALVFGFYGEQIVKSDFTVVYQTEYDVFELRELFGVKVEEDDILTYYILKDGKVVQELIVDYMTADIETPVKLTFEGSNSTLGEYEIRLDVESTAEVGGEENPNTGAESVVGVVAALAVVSVATAAAVSLKK